MRIDLPAALVLGFGGMFFATPLAPLRSSPMNMALPSLTTATWNAGLPVVGGRTAR